MKRYIRSNQEHGEAFNYGMFIIEYRKDGWHAYIYNNPREEYGPFSSWVEAEDFVDHLD